VVSAFAGRMHAVHYGQRLKDEVPQDAAAAPRWFIREASAAASVS